MTTGLARVLGRIEEIQGLMETAAESARPAASTPATDKTSFAATLDGTLQKAGGETSGLRSTINDLVQQAAARYGVDADLIHAVIRAESGYDPSAVSHAGAMGLMQLMPENCRDYGVSDPFDCAQNINAGVRQLKDLISRFGRTDLALAAYNAGPGAVSRYGGIPPYRETQDYVRKITGWLDAGQ